MAMLKRNIVATVEEFFRRAGFRRKSLNVAG
jgi:hypothetical protein